MKPKITLPKGTARPTLPASVKPITNKAMQQALRRSETEIRVQREIDKGEEDLRAAMGGPKLTHFTIVRPILDHADRIIVVMAGRMNVQDRETVLFNIHWKYDTGLICWADTVPQDVFVRLTNAARDKVDILVQDYITRINSGQPAVDLPPERPQRPTKTQVQAQAQNTLEGWDEIIRPIEEKGLKLAGIKVARPKLTLPTSFKTPPAPAMSFEALMEREDENNKGKQWMVDNGMRPGPKLPGKVQARLDRNDPVSPAVVYPPVPKGGPTVPPPIKPPIPKAAWSGQSQTGLTEILHRFDNRDGTFTYNVAQNGLVFYVSAWADPEEKELVWQFPEESPVPILEDVVKREVLKYEDALVKGKRDKGPRTDRGKARASYIGPDRGKPYSSKKAVSAVDLESAVVTHGIEWTIEALAHQCHVFADMEEAHDNPANAVTWRRYANRILNAKIQ